MADDIRTKKYIIEEVERRYVAIGLSSGNSKTMELEPEDILTLDDPDYFAVITFARTGEVTRIMKGRVDWWSIATVKIRREIKAPKKAENIGDSPCP